MADKKRNALNEVYDKTMMAMHQFENVRAMTMTKVKITKVVFQTNYVKNYARF